MFNFFSKRDDSEEPEEKVAPYHTDLSAIPGEYMYVHLAQSTNGHSVLFHTEGEMIYANTHGTKISYRRAEVLLEAGWEIIASYSIYTRGPWAICRRMKAH